MSFETWLAFSAPPPNPAPHPRADGAARRLLCARPGLAHGAADGGRRGARRFHRDDALDARRRRAARRLGDDLHRAEMDRRGLSGLARHKALARRRSARRRAAHRRRVGAKMLGHAWLVTALNPKSITFFVAFLPQFLNPHADLRDADGDLRGDLPGARLRQRASATRSSPRAPGALVRSPRAIGIVNKVGGTCLIGAGVAAVTVRASQ